MIGDSNKNLIKTNIERQAYSQKSPVKKSDNKYYNIFSKKMEEFDLPNIDLEFNAVLIPDKSTVMWTT